MSEAEFYVRIYRIGCRTCDSPREVLPDEWEAIRDKLRFSVREYIAEQLHASVSVEVKYFDDKLAEVAKPLSICGWNMVSEDPEFGPIRIECTEEPGHDGPHSGEWYILNEPGNSQT